jgi:hypothetical protein
VLQVLGVGMSLKVATGQTGRRKESNVKLDAMKVGLKVHTELNCLRIAFCTDLQLVCWLVSCIGSFVLIRGCIQKFPDWPPGAGTANGTAVCH